jgi:multiple sugar transport system substrate-binding protein
VFFRKSVREDNGDEVPATFDEMTTLAQTMQDYGLIPFAFADIDGWPAMGTFDSSTCGSTATTSTST